MPALGNKYECVQCGVKFYDLGKSAAICPSCGTDQSATEAPAEPPAEPPGKVVKVAKVAAATEEPQSEEPRSKEPKPANDREEGLSEEEDFDSDDDLELEVEDDEEDDEDPED